MILSKAQYKTIIWGCNASHYSNKSKECSRNTNIITNLGNSVHLTEGLVVYHFYTGKPVSPQVWTNDTQKPQNGCKGLKLVSKMALKKWNANFCLEYSIWKNRTNFSGVLLLKKFSTGTTQKSCVPFSFQPNFPETFCTWYTTIVTLINTYIHLDLNFQLLKHI